MGSGGVPDGSRASWCMGTWGYGLRRDERSRMSREVHGRICEGVGVRFPRATRRVVFHHTWEGRQRCQETRQAWLKGLG
jgi:hypothetical protein